MSDGKSLTRREKVIESCRLESALGVEIGPLASPIVRRSEGQVLYADHATTEILRQKYAGHGWDTDAIVDVDLNLSGRSLSEALGGRRVDYVIASHVIEHVPNLVGWLRDLHCSLAREGVVSLIVPDKRYCFDAKRPESTTGELIQAHLESRTNPTVRQVFDFWALYCAVDSQAVWSGASNPSELPFSGTKQNAMEKCQELLSSSGYADVHCWVFTPASMLECLADLAELSMMPFALDQFFPTEAGDLEFFVTLRRVEADETPDARTERVAGFRRAAAAAARIPSVLASSPVASAVEPEPLRLIIPGAVVEAGRPLYRALKAVSPSLAETVRRTLRR